MTSGMDEIVDGVITETVTVHMNTTLGTWIGVRVLARAKKQAAKEGRAIDLRGEMKFSQRSQGRSINPNFSEESLKEVREYLDGHLSKKGLAIKDLRVYVYEFNGEYVDLIAYFSIE